MIKIIDTPNGGRVSAKYTGLTKPKLNPIDVENPIIPTYFKIGSSN